MEYPNHLIKLIAIFKKFPGVGARSAERFAFSLLNWPKEQVQEMASLIASTDEEILDCEECGALIGKTACPFCENRNEQVLCVVRSPKDLFLIEDTRAYHGLYHVIGQLLSPIHNQSPPSSRVQKLKERIENKGVKEIIFALDSTLEGDATALYLKRELAAFDVAISKLPPGLPMGSSLDYIDGGTLGRALSGRIHLP